MKPDEATSSEDQNAPLDEYKIQNATSALKHEEPKSNETNAVNMRTNGVESGVENIVKIMVS